MELRKSIERAHVLELNRLSVMKCADPHARGQKSQVRGQPSTLGLRRAEAGTCMMPGTACCSMMEPVKLTAQTFEHACVGVLMLATIG